MKHKLKPRARIQQGAFDSWIGIGTPISHRPHSSFIAKPHNMFVSNTPNNMFMSKPQNISTKSIRPFDFFKTNPQDYPSNMFRDNDRDGVPNAFDCRPNDPTKQGFIDAVIGAVKGLGKKGGVSEGWKAGMAKPGVVKQYKQYRQERQAGVQRLKAVRQTSPVQLKPQTQIMVQNAGQGVMTMQVPKSAKAATVNSQEMQIDISKIPQQLTPSKLQRLQTQRQNLLTQKQILLAERAEKAAPKRERKAIRKLEQEVYEARHPIISKMEKYGADKLKAAQLTIARQAPGYSYAMEFRGKKISALKKQLASAAENKLSAKQIYNIKQKLATASAVQQKAVLQKGRVHGSKVYKTMERSVEQAFPTVLGNYKRLQGAPGRGRGRPRGSLDRRYAAFGGVFGYRKWKSEQNRILKEKVQQQREAMRQQKIMANMPEYEKAQYESQVPLTEEEQIALAQAEAQAQAEQMQQPQQQMPQQQQVQQQQMQPQQPQQQMQPQSTSQQIKAFLFGSGLKRPQQQPQTQQYSQIQPQADYNQPYGMTQKYQQPFMQMPQESGIRPVVPVFKSSGGQAYPPVNRVPLAPSSQTIPQGYTEVVDLMTSRRYLKPVPKKEAWSG